MSDNNPDRRPERPGVEPEILLPSEELRAPRDIAQPRWPAFIFFLILGLIAAFLLIVLAVLVFVGMPLSPRI